MSTNFDGCADTNSAPRDSIIRQRKRQHRTECDAEGADVGGDGTNASEVMSTEDPDLSPYDLSKTDSVLQQMALANVTKKALKDFKKHVVEEMDHQLTVMMEDFLAQVESVRVPQKYRSFIGETEVQEGNRKKRSPCGSLPDKNFVARNSILTDLFEINHIQTIYNIFIAILILLFMHTILEDIVDKGYIDLDFELIKWTFGGLQIVCTIWVGMTIATLMFVYPAYHFWSYQRLSIESKSKRLMWDYCWLALYVAYLIAAIYIPVRESVQANLPPASAFALLLEQVRLLMKTHAFVRSNVPMSLAYCDKQPKKGVEMNEDQTGPCPDFSKYLYFIFAPTLVYRNSYPRTRSVRWRSVCWNFLQVVGVLFYLYFIFVRFCVPVFHRVGHEPVSAKALILAVFGCMLPGTLVLLCGFYCLLHAWLNAFAEMLRFADRMFYQDWWNSHTYASYYRTWNVVVHDWLYTYVYKDCYELCGKSNRVIPTLVVFLISSLFHEYVITFTFRYFYPILLLMFGGFGMVFSFFTNVERRLGNIFMWLTLFIGTGLFMSLYSIEWYARINCPASTEGFLDIIAPRSWKCLTFDTHN